MTHHICLQGVSPELKGKSWEGFGRVRIGRGAHWELPLEDRSVSRCHAELTHVEPYGWQVCDLGSTNGTYLNGERLGAGDRKLRVHDLLQVGNLVLRVTKMDQEDDGTVASFTGTMHIEPSARRSWEEAFALAARHMARNMKAGNELLRVLRAGQSAWLIQAAITLAQSIELHDLYTAGHAQRVTRYALLLADALNLSADARRHIDAGSRLHDIGKIGIHDSVLRKEGPLTREECEQMRAHTVKGAAILATIPELAPVLPIIRNHHERWDGRGYPDRLAGTQIPRLARIVAVADAFDAMTSNRSYRRSLAFPEALDQVRQGAGSQFDPECSRAFLGLEEALAKMVPHAQPVKDAALPPDETASLRTREAECVLV
jgi:HD-GYP domain-containing protein (c-di-GMP phosphodiesterase class II)